MRPSLHRFGRTRVRWVAAAVLLGGAAVAGTAVVGVAPMVDAPPDPVDRVDHVLVVGAPGLRWDDLDPQTTPTLWRLAGRGGVGALSVRAASAHTCPLDGWVTLGAGNRARGPAEPDETCPPVGSIAAPVTSGDTVRLPDQPVIAGVNDDLRHGARPGALADSVRCVTAVGRGAALAAVHPGGRLDHYAETLPARPESMLTRCPVTVVSAGVVADGDRAADLAVADATVAAVERARPASSLLLVVGVSDTGSPPRLHVAIADGPGYDRRWLTSGSTRRPPYVQLIDVAPTALAALGVRPSPVMSGQPMTVADRRPEVATAVRTLIDADRVAGRQRPLVQPFFTATTVAHIGLMLVAAGLFWWRRPSRSDGGTPVVWPEAVTHRLELAAVALATVPVASFMANGLPWWRTPVPAVAYGALILASVAAVTALAYLGPWRRARLGPPTCVAVVTAVVLGLDVLTGSTLQLNAVAGYSPLVAGRFTGFGNLAFAVFAAGALVGAGCLAQRYPGWRRVAILAGCGVLAVALVGAPNWGSDVGGIVALTPAFVLAGIRAGGMRLSPVLVAGALGVGLLTVVGFALADYARPPDARTHLGRFVAQLRDGTAGTVVQRKAEANLSLLVNSQLTLLVVVAVVFVAVVLLGPAGGLRRVFGLFPSVAGAFSGVLVAAVVGFAVNDSGIAVPAFAAMVAVPLALATALRVGSAAARRASPPERATPSTVVAEPGRPLPPTGAAVVR